MGVSVLATSLLMSFFNIGVIGGLQRLMHLLDLDVGGRRLYPWRTELWYGLYMVVIGAALLIAGRYSSGWLQLLLVNCQVVLAITFPNALKTLPAVLTSVVAAFGTFAVVVGTSSWAMGLAVAGWLIYLAVQEAFFAPFDQFMTIRILADLAAGAGFWWLLQRGWHLSTAQLATVLISYLVTVCATFTYMVLLRREHIVDLANARNVAYDGLTDAYNWLSFRTQLTHAYADSPSDLSLLAIDVDDFKAINTQFGHAVGNQVLISFVDRLKAALEVAAPQSFLARTGGESFMLILPHTDAAKALAVAKVCQAQVRELVVPLDEGKMVQLTASFGVASSGSDDQAPRDLYRRADRCLQAAKQAGRDRIRTDIEA